MVRVVSYRCINKNSPENDKPELNEKKAPSTDWEINVTISPCLVSVQTIRMKFLRTHYLTVKQIRIMLVQKGLVKKSNKLQLLVVSSLNYQR